MNKTINLIGIIIISSFCSCTNYEQKKVKAENTLQDEPIIVFDSCEYITYRTYGGSTNITHKGNCKFCINRLKNIIGNSNKKEYGKN